MDPDPVARQLAATVDGMAHELIQLRRDIHRNPELSWRETRTTALVADRLARAGVKAVPVGVTGLVADLGPADPVTRVALRADLDALPLHERTGLPYASRVLGVSHACGHDVHTASLLGAGLALAAHESLLLARGLGVRLLFQPAEEAMPGGAHALLERGAMAGVDRVFAVHCDPGRDVGQVGLRVGPITSAADAITVRLRGAGGHTSRPHLTSDLTYALAKVITDVPAALSRRLDPRAGGVLVWGSVHAGAAANVIPEVGEVQGTVRMLDADAWVGMEALLRELIDAVASPYGAKAEVTYQRGVPPVVNAAVGVEAFARAARAMLGPRSVGPTQQSLGGEDFGWLLRESEGALARLGTRTPGGATYDLHQGDLVVDEASIVHGAKLLAAVALASSSPAQAARRVEAGAIAGTGMAPGAP